MQDRFFKLNDLTLHAVTHGDPSKPPIVLLHGFMDHAHSWDFVAPLLTERFYVIALDFRGFGDSAWAPDGVYQFANYQLDVAAIWREFKLETAAVVGHSMGGNVAMQWAGLYPKRVSKLVLVEGFGPPVRSYDEYPTRTATWVEGLLTRPTKHPKVLLSLEEAASRLLETNPQLTEERATYLASFATKSDGTSFTWKFDPAHRLPAPNPYNDEGFIPFWKRIQAPTLALHGELGPLTVDAVSSRYAHFPNLKTEVIAGAGHGIHIEQPKALADAILVFTA